MKFVQHPPSESKGSQGVPSIPTLTIVSTADAVAPTPAPAPVISAPVAAAPLAGPLVIPVKAVEVTVPWQSLMDQQSRALEMDLKKGQVVSTQQLKQQLQGLVQSQQSMKDVQAAHFEKTVESVKQEWQEELKTLEKNFESQKTQWSGELESKKSTIDALQKEIAETHKQLEQLAVERKAAAVRVAPVAPAPMPVVVEAPPPVHMITPSVLPPLDRHASAPTRDSFLKKIWNYLNQPAIEVPLPTHRFRD